MFIAAAVSGLAAAGGLQEAYAQHPLVEVTATGMLDNNNSIELDSPYAVDIFTIGGNTYAAIAARLDNGLQIVDVSDPDNPAPAGKLEDTEGSNELLLEGAFDVDVFMIGSNTYVAVASFVDDGLQIVDVSDPANPSAAGSLGNDGTRELNGARGVDVFTIGSNTYVAVASFDDDGLQIVDVSDPANPSAAGSLGNDGTRELNGARGVDVFTIGSNTYAAVIAETDDGLQIVDVSDPDNPAPAGKLEDTVGSDELLLDDPYDVDVFTIGSNTYAAVASWADDGLQIVDVTDPDNPAAVGSLGDGGSRLLDGASAVSTFTIGDKAYAAVTSTADDGLQIVDVTNPASPAAVGSLKDGGSRELDGALGVNVFMIGSRTYAAVTSFLDDGLQLAEISQIPASPDSPIPSGSLPDGTSLLLEKSRSVDTFEIGGSTYAVAVSSSENGTQIVDVTNPAAPTATGNLADDTTRLLEGARGVKVFMAGGNTYAVVTAHGDDGVEVIDVTDPDNPASVGRLADDGSRLLDGATAVTTFGIGTDTYAAVTSQHDGGLQIIDITNPASPAAADKLEDDGSWLLGDTSAVDTFEIGGSTYAVVASWADDGLQIVDVTDPDNLAAAGQLADDNDLLLRGIRDMAVFETGGSVYAAVASWADDGLQIVDITDPDNPAAAGKLADDNDLLLDGASGVEIFRTDMKVYAAVASQTDDGIQIVDITDPDNPLGAGLVGDGPLYSLDAARDLAVFMMGSNTYTVVASDTEGLQTVKLTEAHNNAPVLGTIGDQTAAPDIQLVITPTVTDADSTDTHTYLISRGTLPAAAVFDTADGSIVWTPVQGDVGQTHTVTITVDDGRGGADSETFDIVVGELAAVGSLGDDTNLLLGGAHDVDTFTIGQNTYAVVVAETDDGIQIVDVTNPASPVAVGHLSDDTNILLDGPRGVDISVIGGNTYAIVATYFESALQIVNVTDPTDPVAAGSLKDTNSLELETPQAVAVFTIGSNTYAAVASYQDNALQIVDITNPAAPMATGNLKDGGSARLDGPRDVEIFTIGSNTYAAVASSLDNALQIVDVTDPADPTPAGRLSDTGSRELGGPRGVEIFTICSNTYAAVAAYKDHGLQIVDVTDPADPMPTGKLEDSNSRNLQSPRGVAVFTTGSNIYAAVASFHDDGLQIVDVTDPTDPTPAGRLSDTGSRELGGASAVTTFTIGSNTYAAVASTSDNGLQLARLGAEAGTLPNCVPVLGAIGNQTATPGMQLTITPMVTDADTTDTHTYSITRGTLPAAAVFNTSDGTLVWTPVQGDVGQTHQVTITVDDGRGGTDSETFDIAVADEGTIPPNSSPVAPNETATTAEDTPITITPAISDPDTSDTPVISAVENPPNGSATHDDTTITYIPDQDYVGTDTFGYTISDGTDTAQGTVTITVTRDNNDPVMDTIGNQNAVLDIPLTVTPRVTDADTTDTHTYSISRGTLPAAAVFNTSDGTLVWTPVQGDVGQTHQVTITVDDGRGGTDSETFGITVAARAVIILNGTDPWHHELGDDPYIDPGAEATDGSTVNTDASAVDVNVAGNYTVNYTATDTQGDIIMANRTVQVRDTTPPVIDISGNPQVTTPLGSEYTDAGATSTDNDPNYADAVSDDAASVDTSRPGTYTVTYTATDAAGNTGTATRTVTIPVEYITMGALIPQTGGLGGQLGEHHTFAANAAVDDLNAYLERNGAVWRADQLVINDTEAADVQTLIRSLDSAGITMVSGPVRSSELDAIRNYADSNGMILVSCCSTALSLAIEGDNIFRLAPDDSQQGSVIAGLLGDEYEKDVMVVVWRDDIWGEGIRNSAVTEFEALGGTADELGSYDPDDPDLDGTFEALAARLSTAVSGHVENVGADRVSVLFIGQEEMSRFVAKAAGHPVLGTVQWMGSDASVNSAALVDAPRVFEFLRDADFQASVFAEDSDSPAYRYLTDLIDDEFGTAPAVYTYGMYDTIWVMGLALEEAGWDAEPEEIRAALPEAASRYEGAIGDINLNAAGDLDWSVYAVWGIDDSGWMRLGVWDDGFKPDSRGGGNDDEWQTAPTFGVSPQTGGQMVSCGYSMDGICRDVLDYHVDYRRESIQTDTKHDFTLRAHSVTGVQQFQIGFGVPGVGSPIGDSEAVLTVELGRDYSADSTYEILDAVYTDPNDVIGEAALDVELVGCMSPGDPTRCVELSIEGLLFREQMYHEPFVIYVMDVQRWSAQNYMNEGLLVQGDSMNPAPLDTAGIYKRGQQYEAAVIQLERTDKLADLWADQWGNEWARNSHGTWYRTVPDAFERHQDDMWTVMNRMNSNFATLVQAEQDRAVLVFDAAQLVREPGSVFAYEYPDIQPGDVRLEQLADALLAERLRAQEIIDRMMSMTYHVSD